MTLVIAAIFSTGIFPTLIADEGPDFASDVRPILSDHCFQCHGPGADSRAGKLGLDRRDTAARVLEPGDDSKILKRIFSQDPNEIMPPPEAKHALSDDQKNVLREWVLSGAKYEDHWSFLPIRNYEAPQTSSSWGTNAVDAFVLRTLRQKKLEPAERASRESLIRRLSLDLTGLPPSLDAIDRFLEDDSPAAYDRLVDALLGRHEFGEHLAASWLDIARYSDSYGYQVDRDRFVWPWRDWVIDAINANKPFDEFATEQLAGDLLPDASDDQILATTFNRLHPQKVEGGSVPEEFRVEYVADRTHTFATAFLGLTLECSRCHDHKYDPLTQKEYYQLFSFFANVDEAGLYSYFTSSVPTPTLLMMDDAKKAKLAAARGEVRRLEQAESKLRDSKQNAFDAWLKDTPESTVESPGLVKHLDFESFKSGANKSVPGPAGKGVQLSGDDGIGTGVGNFRRFQAFSVALWLRTPEVMERAVVFHRSRAWTDAGSRGYQLLLEDGRLSASLIHFWPGNAIRVRSKTPIETATWKHVAITYDGSSRADGLRIYVDGKPADTEVVQDTLYKNISGGGGDTITIGQRFRDKGFRLGQVDEFRVYDRRLSQIEIIGLSGGSANDALQSYLAGAATDRDLLFEYFSLVVDKEFDKARNATREARKKVAGLLDPTREIMVMREAQRPKTSYLLTRGAYDVRAEAVQSTTPAVFPPLDSPASSESTASDAQSSNEDSSRRKNRLDLARWLTSKDHPLAARVVVNRLWQSCFGEGLVRTPEDFGSQGEPPTHPELLDWLARDLIDHGWDIKRTLKIMVTSATYQQSSVASSDARTRDPDNRWLSHSSSYRWPAELIRDNALAASDLLDRKVGGNPVKPYDLAVSFKPLSHDKGSSLYRRSLYTYWKRTAPSPAMIALDAAKRDVCRVRRERTASPIQAFVLLNGPQFVEAARYLGQRMLARHGSDRKAMIVEMFRRLTSRHPTARELDILGRLFSEQLEEFSKDEARAKSFLGTGHVQVTSKSSPAELAAAAMLASALMNYDESVVKR